MSKYIMEIPERGGYGDDIMVTGEARELKKNNPHAKIIVGDGHKQYDSIIFKNNPNISNLEDVKPEDEVIWIKSYWGNRPYLDLSRTDNDYKQFFKNHTPIPGDLFLSSKVDQSGNNFIKNIRKKGKPVVFIEPNVEFTPNKDWGFENWEKLTELLKKDISFVQPTYQGATHLLKVDLFESSSFLAGCAALKYCDLHVGPEGGLHHAAAALGIPAVVLFGGRIHPETVGYDSHINLYIDDADSPCGMRIPCEHCKKCMSQITIEDVANSIRKLINRHSKETSPT